MNPNFRLFLDDLREPSFLYRNLPNVRHENWQIARTVDQAKRLIAVLGYPVEISFDHDLGEDTETGYDFVKWLIEKDLDDNWMGSEFFFGVHSMNPVGAENINKTLTRYLELKNEY